VINTLIRDNIKIVPVQNMNETIEMLCELYKRFDKDAKKYMSSSSTSKEQSITNIPQHSKRVYLTIEKYLTSVLCQIPGVSTTIASQISDHYSDNLYNFVTTAQVEDIEVIKLKSGRRIGGKLASQIIEFIQKEKCEKNI
jgi:ERCC4-type nuclease